jgi:hypothetical protein
VRANGRDRAARCWSLTTHDLVTQAIARAAMISSHHKGSAVVFFTVRNTSSEFDRATPGKRISTSE